MKTKHRLNQIMDYCFKRLKTNGLKTAIPGCRSLQRQLVQDQTSEKCNNAGAKISSQEADNKRSPCLIFIYT